MRKCIKNSCFTQEEVNLIVDEIFSGITRNLVTEIEDESCPKQLLQVLRGGEVYCSYTLNIGNGDTLTQSICSTLEGLTAVKVLYSSEVSNRQVKTKVMCKYYSTCGENNIVRGKCMTIKIDKNNSNVRKTVTSGEENLYLFEGNYYTAETLGYVGPCCIKKTTDNSDTLAYSKICLMLEDGGYNLTEFLEEVKVEVNKCREEEIWEKMDSVIKIRGSIKDINCNLKDLIEYEKRNQEAIINCGNNIGNMNALGWKRI